MTHRIKHPLTDEHCKCLNKVLESMPTAFDLAQACIDCGWDVTDLVDTLRAQKKMAETAKAKFFPERS